MTRQELEQRANAVLTAIRTGRVERGEAIAVLAEMHHADLIRLTLLLAGALNAAHWSKSFAHVQVDTDIGVNRSVLAAAVGVRNRHSMWGGPPPTP